MLVAFLMISVDGFHATADGDLDWHTVDREFERFAVEQLDSAAMLVFGRNTYEGMAAFWPGPLGEQADHETAVRMNRLPKVVCSRTLEKAEWGPARVIREDAAAALGRMKRETSVDLLLLGSATLLASLLDAGVVDELRLMKAPVALRKGEPALAALPRHIGFERRDVRRFANGNVLLTYRPAASE